MLPNRTINDRMDSEFIILVNGDVFLQFFCCCCSWIWWLFAFYDPLCQQKEHDWSYRWSWSSEGNPEVSEYDCPYRYLSDRVLLADSINLSLILNLPIKSCWSLFWWRMCIFVSKYCWLLENVSEDWSCATLVRFRTEKLTENEIIVIYGVVRKLVHWFEHGWIDCDTVPGYVTLLVLRWCHPKKFPGIWIILCHQLMQ